MKKQLSLFLCSLLLMGTLHAQESPNSELYKTLKSKDSLLFNVTFNTCDLRPLDDLISDDLEFYHDQGGITNGKQAFIATVKNNICSLPYKATRQLVKGSLKVYPMKNNGVLYAAVQEGVHQFFATEGNKPPRLTSTAKFTHLWLLDNGQWKLKRVLSYDHQSNEQKK